MELSDFIDPYQLRRVLILMIYIMLVIVIMLFIALVVHKLAVEFRERKLRRLREIYIGSVSRRLVEEDFVIQRPAKRIEFEALSDVIIDMLASITGEIAAKIRGIALELGLNEYFRGRVSRGSWVHRLIGVEKLSFLKMPEMKGFFHSMIAAERDEQILSKAVVALSFLADDRDDIDAINGVLNNPAFRSAKFNEYVYTNIIKSFREKGQEARFAVFLEDLADDPSVSVMLKRDIVEACGSETFHPVTATILRYYRSFTDTPEMRIACIRALGRLGGQDACEIMESCLADGDWRVRAVAAKNAHLCPEDIIGYLREALRDQNYYVRLNAALSLSKLGDKGIMALREEVESTDRFTRDVSAYILDEVKLRA